MYPEYHVSPDQWQAFLADQRGCVVGSEAREEVRLEGRRHVLPREFHPALPPGGRPFEFVVSGIYDADLVKYPGTDVSTYVLPL